MTILATLAAWDTAIHEAAARLGIDPGPVDWRLVDADRLYELAAVGMPGVMRHWTHGRDYWLERSRFSQGYGRLYEMMVHADPPIAYLLDGNTLPAQKAVMAHCLGHALVFRHHRIYAGVPTDGPTHLAAQEARRAAYAAEYGADAVEWVLDRAMALEDQVAAEPERPRQTPPERTDPYADLFPRTPPPKPLRPPRYRLPTRDVLGFIARESPVLAAWERDLALAVREERLLLMPGGHVIKHLHEGFAAWTNQRLLTDPAVPMTDWEQAEAAVLWAHVASPFPDRLNPYWFGYRFFEELEKEYGLRAAWTIWTTETDTSLVRNYLTPDMARALQLYHYHWDDEFVKGKGRFWVARRAAWPTTEEDWAAWRNALADTLIPPIPEVWVTGVTDSGMLVLTHQTPSRPLDPEWAEATLHAVRDLWGAPVQLIDGDTEYVVTRKEQT